MAVQPSPRILCLDGGGIRGLAEILILKVLMLQVRMQKRLDFTPEPRQCFDFICGTSTGGLIAVLIGRLGKTLDECEALFREVGSKIFSGGSAQRSARLALVGSKHTSEGLVEVIRSQAGEESMYEPESDCSVSGHIPVAVAAVSGTTRAEQLFRTYGIRAMGQNCSVVDACRATSAATTFFDPITINGVSYVDGAFGMNNPSSAALKELESGEGLPRLANAVKEVGCFVSVGAGRPTFARQKVTVMSKLTPKGVDSGIDAASRCIKIATDCHKAHEDVKYRFNQEGRIDVYHRFDVDAGLESVKLNEADEETLQHISAVTMAYLNSHRDELVKCALLMSPRINYVSNQLSGLVLSSLPLMTDLFCGREPELCEMRNSLDPLRPGRKSLLICGMGGSGKTQLMLRHIQQEGLRYSAIVWVNASTEEHARRSFAEASGFICSRWPPDLPLVYAGPDATLRVTSRLRSTTRTNWLLVIDRADNP